MVNIFDTLIANRPTQEVTPTIQGRGASNFFSDEQSIYNKMLQDGLDDTKARSLITKNRQKQLGQITSQEKDVLLKMQQDGLDSKKAVQLVRQNRQKNLPLYKKAAKFVFDAGVEAAGMATEQVGKVGGFLGATEWERKGIEARDIAQRTTGDSAGAAFGRTTLGAGELFAASPTKIAPTLFGRTVQGAGVGAIVGAGEEIVGRGSEATVGDVVKSAATDAAIFAAAAPLIEKVALPVIVKTIQKTYGAGKGIVTKGAKYGTAAQKGGIEGLEKSIIRDIKRPFKSINLKGLAPDKAASLSTKANRFNARDIEKFKQITGETPGEFAVKRGMTKVGDEAVDEATNLYVKSMKEADDSLKLIDGTFKIKKGPDFLLEMLTDLSSRLKKTIGPGRRKAELLLKKYKSQGLTMSEINEMKRLYSKNFKYTWADAASESALRSRNLQDGVRKWQFKTAEGEGLTNLKQINKTTQGWRTFADSLAKKLKRSSGNNSISLTDWVALSGGEPTNVALFLGKKVGELTPVKRALIKSLGKKTKEPIIKASRESILKANLKKENVNINRILSDRTSSRSDILVKPKVVKKPTPKKVTKPKVIKKPQKIDSKKKVGDNKTILSKSKRMGTTESALVKEAKKLGFETKGEDVVLYRGYGSVTDKKGNYFTGDKDYASNFSLYGDDTMRKIEVSPKEIYKAKVLPEAVNEAQVTKTISEAKKGGFKAIYVDEGGASTPSVFYINAK